MGPQQLPADDPRLPAMQGTDMARALGARLVASGVLQDTGVAVAVDHAPSVE